MSENNGKSADARYIADHSSEFGFEWFDQPISGALKKGEKPVQLSSRTPTIRVSAESLPRFVKSFGAKVVAGAINGTSLDVAAERVVRDTLTANRSVKYAELQEKVVNSVLLGIVTRTTRKVFVGKGGVEFATAEEAEKSFAPTTPQQTPDEQARAFLARAAENGVDPVEARKMAQFAFPTATWK